MVARYVSSRAAPDTVLMTFRVVHGQRAVIDGDVSDDAETGRSPISRWIAWAFDYDDFISSTGTVSCICRLIIPRGTIGMEVFARVDLAFAAAVPAAHISLGDGNDQDGWGDSMDWTSTGLKRDVSAAYMQFVDPVQASAGWQYYAAGDTLDVGWSTVTLPTAGRAIVFMKCVSYHEDLESEW